MEESRVIVPYAMDDEHNAPKYIRPQAYTQRMLNCMDRPNRDMRREATARNAKRKEERENAQKSK